ncbi:MAG: LysR family transcriptional regulator [Acidimicrobiia bacterium]|nr:LysR family transcriptional regulator [Acidimicrobiia bacterium]
MFDLRRLQFLREVASRGTISAAAEALAYTPSAVSQQLTVLEREVGAPLLERRGRNVVLTPAGEVLVAHSDAVLDAVEAASAAVAGVTDEIAGRLDLGSFQSAAVSLLPRALRTLRDEHPNLDARLVLPPLEDAVRELRLGTLDIAVDQRYCHVPHNRHDGLDLTSLFTERLFVLSPADDPVATLADAAHRHFVMSPTHVECGRSVSALCATMGFEPDVRHHVEDFEATRAIVAAGLAVAVLPELALVGAMPGIHVATVPDAHREVVAVIRPASAGRRVVQAGIEHLEKAATSLPVVV